MSASAKSVAPFEIGDVIEPGVPHHRPNLAIR